MELTPLQLILIGLIASLVVQGVKIGLVALGKMLQKEVKITKFWASVIAVVVSYVLALIWNPSALPPLDDPMAFINALLLQIGIISGYATLIYNLVLVKLLEGLGLSETKFAYQP